MKTKDVLLVVGGVALGYLASRKNWGKKTATAVGDAGQKALGVGHAIVSDVKDVAKDTAKMTDCEKKLNEATSTMRFASAEAGANYGKEFLASCMASK